MRRVLHYVSGFAETCGGIESVLLSIFTQFNGDKEIEMELLTRYAYSETECYKGFVGNGYKVTSLGIQHLSLLNMRDFKAKLRTFFLCNSFDVLHMHGTDEPFVIEEARRSGVKKVIVHSHTPDMELNGRPQIYLAKHRVLQRYNTAHSDIRIAVSKETGECSFGKYKFIPLKNGIDTERFRFRLSVREKVRKSLNLDGPTLIHIGRFVDVKNQGFVIKIFKTLKEKIPEAKLLFAGSGVLLQDCKNKAKDCGLSDSICFLGDRSDVPELLMAADAFVMPSLFEGFSVSLVEAQASGLPCIASDVIPDYSKVTELVQYLPLAASAEEWAEKIFQIMTKVDNREDYADIVAISECGMRWMKKRLCELYFE